MPLTRSRIRVPIGVQVGVVAALFVAALVVLWATGALVMARERRRSEAKSLLDHAGNDLENAGREEVARAGGEFPEYRDERVRETVDHVLAVKAAAALANYKVDLPPVRHLWSCRALAIDLGPGTYAGCRRSPGCDLRPFQGGAPRQGL